mgnify:CR=1 FL=1
MWAFQRKFICGLVILLLVACSAPKKINTGIYCNTTMSLNGERHAEVNDSIVILRDDVLYPSVYQLVEKDGKHMLYYRIERIPNKDDMRLTFQTKLDSTDLLYIKWRGNNSFVQYFRFESIEKDNAKQMSLDQLLNNYKLKDKCVFKKL